MWLPEEGLFDAKCRQFSDVAPDAQRYSVRVTTRSSSPTPEDLLASLREVARRRPNRRAVESALVSNSNSSLGCMQTPAAIDELEIHNRQLINDEYND
jgi:hypothetical protein